MGATRGSPAAAGNLLFSTRTPQYICRSCRQSFLKSQTNNQQRRHASNDIPFTEKLRRKIWGTDNPPGLKDPYGGPSFLERAMNKNASKTTPKQTTQLLERNDQVLEQAPRTRRAEVADRLMPTERYIPAETWDGLDHIGTVGDWRSLPVVDEDIPSSWRDQYTSVESFSTRGIDFASLTCSMHQAIVECLACNASEVSEPSFHYLPEETSVIRDTRISVAEDGALYGLEFDSETDKAAFHKSFADAKILKKISKANDRENAFERREAVVPSYEPDDQSFLKARLNFEDPLTFAILKRFSGLSGISIPDPILNSIMSGNKPISHLMHQLVNSARPKPKTVTERLAKSEALLNQSNVMVLSRRETPVDKEKEVGRWKVIEKELTDRGLPVLGKAYAH